MVECENLFNFYLLNNIKYYDKLYQLYIINNYTFKLTVDNLKRKTFQFIEIIMYVDYDCLNS